MRLTVGTQRRKDERLGSGEDLIGASIFWTIVLLDSLQSSNFIGFSFLDAICFPSNLY